MHHKHLRNVSHMNCKQAQLIIDDYVDDYLTDFHRNAVESHFEECNRCRCRFNERRNLVAELGNLPKLAGPSTDFRHRVLQARQQQITMSKRRKQWLQVGTLTSMAASFLIGIAVSIYVYIGDRSFEETTGDIVTNEVEVIPEITHKVITVLFNSKASLGNVKFSVTPPESVDIEGFVGERTVVWNGKLKKGENILKIPLIVNRGSSSSLLVCIEHNREKRKFFVSLDAARLRPAAT